MSNDKDDPSVMESAQQAAAAPSESMDPVTVINWAVILLNAGEKFYQAAVDTINVVIKRKQEGRDHWTEEEKATAKAANAAAKAYAESEVEKLS